MRKRVAMFLALFLSLSPLVVFAATQDYYVKSVDAVIKLNTDWLCLTKDTDPSDIDLAGTPLNYEGAKSAILQTLDLLNSPAYNNVHLVALGFDEEVGLAEIQVSSSESDDTRAVWDISLIPNFEKTLTSQVGAVDVYSSKTDTWYGVEQAKDGYTALAYMTINNGRNVAVHVTAYNANSQSERVEAARKFIDRVQFTKKDPKPVEHTVEEIEPDNRDFISEWLTKMWGLIERCLAFEMSNWILVGVVAVIGCIFGGIASLFKRK